MRRAYPDRRSLDRQLIGMDSQASDNWLVRSWWKPRRLPRLQLNTRDANQFRLVAATLYNIVNPIPKRNAVNNLLRSVVLMRRIHSSRRSNGTGSHDFNGDLDLPLSPGPYPPPSTVTCWIAVYRNRQVRSRRLRRRAIFYSYAAIGSDRRCTSIGRSGSDRRRSSTFVDVRPLSEDKLRNCRCRRRAVVRPMAARVRSSLKRTVYAGNRCGVNCCGDVTRSARRSRVAVRRGAAQTIHPPW